MRKREVHKKEVRFGRKTSWDWPFCNINFSIGAGGQMGHIKMANGWRDVTCGRCFAKKNKKKDVSKSYLTSKPTANND